MRAAQKALAGFLPLVDWTRFRRININEELTADQDGLALFGCGDADQAIVWCLRSDTIDRDGRLKQDAPAITPTITVPGLGPGRFVVSAWHTEGGHNVGEDTGVTNEQRNTLVVRLPAFVKDCAFAIRRINV
jgi:mannan endo-1,4-beta-mannosidase